MYYNREIYENFWFEILSIMCANFLQIHHMLASKTRKGPKTYFVRAFDTVKAVNDHLLFDISLTGSVTHLRHAIALNENRDAMTPEYMYPYSNDRTGHLGQRTFVQAWFVGFHIDMGGSAANHGLLLYPLPWMLLECKKLWLCLGYETFSGRSTIINPLAITGIDNKDQVSFTFVTENGISVEMHDIREM